MSGVRAWRVKTNLHEILDDDLSLEETAQQISARIRLAAKKIGESDNDDLYLILDELKDVAASGDVEDFDGVLDSLYDWCDRERVWIGGEG